MTITFYTNPMTRGQIARWALHEAGADYDEVVLGFGPAMKTPDYLALNPMGKVPTIVHDEMVITECAAICLYLATAFPQAELQPHTLAEQADYFRWTLFGAGPVEQAIVNNTFGWGADDPQTQGRLGYGSYDLTMKVLSELFNDRQYVCGDRFTAADIYLGAQVVWGLRYEIVTSTPNLEAYAARLRERDAYKVAQAIDTELIAKMQDANPG